MKMVICGSSYADPTKTKVIERVVRYTNILGAPISYLPNEDGKLIDTGQIIIAQKLLDDGIVEALCHFQAWVHSHLCQTSDT